MKAGCTRALLGRLVGIMVSGWLVPGVTEAAPAEPPPNIVYILADDLGIGDVSCYNPQSAWRTPQLDRLATQGIRFTDAHSASGVCTPSRYALLTGRYAWRGRLKSGVVDGYAPPLIEAERLTVPAFLRTQGYVTAMFGKWHLGLDWSRSGPSPEDVDFSRPFAGGPLAHGFDRFFGISASLDMPPYVWLENDRAKALPTATVEDSPAPKLWRAGVTSPDFDFGAVQPTLTDKTVAYLAERRRAGDGAPFFLYLALAGPHTPVVPTREFEGKSRATSYGDFVTQFDADIGRILAALEGNGFAENTLVIFSSDNGFAPPAGLEALRRLGHDPSAGFRGFKSDLFEGGHRVPLIVRWPAVTSGGKTSAALVGQLDLFATCAEIVGALLPASAAEDSVSFLSILRGGTSFDGARPSLVHHSSEGQFSIREGRWKLLLWAGSGGWSAPTPTPSRWLRNEVADLSLLPAYQLYDMSTDPAEQVNLAGDHPEIVQRLGRLLRDTIERGRSTPGVSSPLPFHPDWPQTSWMKDFER